MKKGIWAGSWQDGDYTSGSAERSGNQLTVRLQGELPRKNYDVQLVQEGPTQFRLQWRGGGCVVTDVAAGFDKTWTFNGKFKNVRSITVTTANGQKTIQVRTKK